MIGAGILDGDIAVLDADGEPADGSIAAVVLDEEATLKRLYRCNGGLRLVAENPAFPDRNITIKDSCSYHAFAADSKSKKPPTA